MTEVKCKVRSCHYWGSGDVCEADTILVDNNLERKNTTKMEAGNLDIDRGTTGGADRDYGTTKVGGTRADFEAGDLGGTATRTAGTDESGLAYTSETTCCRTFRPKGSARRS
ncbi:MAG TPA: DUF1540 domain-containing protein [Firmicutes bacterium]|uniref:DUF1540 domain-containing protein n=1 Tax=Candidatus Fermentithermobacillus carboniphilus TaxID=3085328 RepID=A0AAT9L9Q8_9FIRM|nr:MAG: DUF1540 domain-containing protein [Candidatus Fermentithermobacillus carboniphilus]HHW17439.1 DUF1540 domain-containing protein [Candidatus Fermentithermobacillaceae bacterium]